MRGLILNTGTSKSGIGNYVKLIADRLGSTIDLLNIRLVNRGNPICYPKSSTGVTLNLTLEWDPLGRVQGIHKDSLGSIRHLEQSPTPVGVHQRITLLGSGIGILTRHHIKPLVGILDSLPGGYDFVHVASQDLALIIPYLRDRYHCPVALTVHDTGVFKVYATPFLVFIRVNLWNAHLADSIMVDCETTRRNLMEINPLCSRKTTIVPLSVNEHIFYQMDKVRARRELDLPSDSGIVLSIGRDWYPKNVKTTLKAFAHPLCNRYFLVRVGAFESSRSVYDSLPSKVRSRILLRQEVSDVELPLYYSAANVLVFPSLKEGFGLEILESAFCGTPIITVDRDPMNSVAPKMTTLVRDPSNWREIAKLISNHIDGPLSTKDYGVCSERYRTDLGSESFLSAFRDTIKMMLAGWNQSILG